LVINNLFSKKILTHIVLADYNRRGWAEENETRIRKDYPKILHVGVDSNPPPDSSDEIIAEFCEKNNCDLLTSDKRAYAALLKNDHVKAVQISKYDWDDKAGQQVYLIKIL